MNKYLAPPPHRSYHRVLGEHALQGAGVHLGVRLYALFPGMTILITVLCINFIGDGLRDAFDPRSFER